MNSRSVTFVDRLSNQEDREKFQKEQAALKKRFDCLNTKALELEKKLTGIMAVYETLRNDERIKTEEMRACKNEEEKSKMKLELQTISVNIQNAYKTECIAGNTLNSTIDECNAVGRTILW